MSNIAPVGTERTQIEFSKIGGQLLTSQVNQPQISTLCSASTKNRGVVGWISNWCGRVWTAIKNFLTQWSFFKTCFRSDKEIDWEATKVIFAAMKKAVDEAPEEFKPNQERFNTHYADLSQPAKDLFEMHIGYSIARRNRAIDKADQEKYVSEKWSEISRSLKTILADITRDEVREAVVSFERELDKHQ
ncbi:MAG: hypothetical protein JSS30_02210 [Verrucomicrobia bacterium]|nr:hypothetical protein [Verrucomicrobiota bacterium]